MGLFTGFLPLYKTAAKQNAHLIAPWIVLISVLSVTSFIAYDWIFPHTADRIALSMTIGSNPAFNLIFGEAHNLLSAEGFNTWRSLALGSLFAGLMTIFIVVRETRAKEDSGEAEIVAANVVGRNTQLAVAVVLAWMASILLGVVAASATILVGGNVTDSIMLALAWTASGIIFSAVAAIACQLGSYARTANSIAVTFLGVCFLVRGYADASPDVDWLLWLTPFGWLQKIEPAGANAVWPLLFAAGATFILLVIAGLLSRRRDFGQGLLPSRPGVPRAGLVRSLYGLALRLQGSSVISWTISFVVLGSVFGYLVSSLGSVFSRNAQIAHLLAAGSAPADQTFEFIGTLLQVLGIIAALYGVQVMMRIYNEEMSSRVAPLLAGATTRWKVFISHVAIAFIGPAIGLTLSACMIAFIATSKGASVNAWDIIRQALVELPAVWVLIGISVATIGARPVVRFVSWMAIVVTFALTILGPLFNLWDWVLGISPLWHVPNVVDLNADWSQLVWLCAVVVGLLLIGFIGFTKRDIERV